MMNTLSSTNPRSSGAQTVYRQPASAPPLALIVVDDEETRFMLRTILEMREGVSVIEAENGELAATLAESMHPDLILMDGTLPLLDGFAATRRIREFASGCDVPMVFLSGHTEPAFEAQAFAAGGNDYLVKPFALSELKRVLERHLSERISGKLSPYVKGTGLNPRSKGIS